MPKPTFPENVFRNDITHRLRELREYCRENNAPMFVTVYCPLCDTYVSEILSPKVLGVELKDDRITGHLNVANGFRTVPKETRLYQYNSDGELVEGDEEDMSDILSAVASCEEDNDSLE